MTSPDGDIVTENAPIDLKLTSDNLQLSRPNMADVGALSPIATNCKRLLLERVTDYVRDSVADNTRRAYLSDLAHFEG